MLVETRHVDHRPVGDKETPQLTASDFASVSTATSNRSKSLSELPGESGSDSLQADLQDDGFDAVAMHLSFAASVGSYRHVKRLLAENMTIVDAKGLNKRTALHVAVESCQIEIVRFLLQHGAKLSVKDKWGKTPHDLANQIDPLEARLDMLMALGVPNSNTSSMSRQSSPRSPTSPTSPTSPKLRTDGMSRNTTPSSWAATPYESEGVVDMKQQLFCAAAAGSVGIVQDLVVKGASLHVADEAGQTVMHVASSHGKSEMVAYVLQQGVDATTMDASGNCPSVLAQMNGNSAVVEVLIQQGVNSKDELMRKVSYAEEWAIESSEVKLQNQLSVTEKSTVYTALWNGTIVVAKTIKAQPVHHGDEEDTAPRSQVEELFHEVEILSKVRHPDLVLFLGACFDTPPYYVITEYMEGGDLKTHYDNETRRLGRRYKCSYAQLLKWSSSIARALCFLHNRRHPIIHRDLKPLNIFLTKQMDAKVADFGISKILSGKKDTKADDPQYMSGGVGTWRYMAPEVVRYEQYTDRVDVYSFGLIMYYMATGIPPFFEEFGGNAELILKEFLKGNEPRPKLSNVGKESLRQFIELCWSPHCEIRPSAEDCVKRLAEMSTGSTGLISSSLDAVRASFRTRRPSLPGLNLRVPGPKSTRTQSLSTASGGSTCGKARTQSLSTATCGSR